MTKIPRLIIFFIFIFAVSVVANGQDVFTISSKFEPFQPVDGRFSINMQPTFSDDNAIEAKAGGKKYRWKNEKATFTLAYIDKPGARSEDAEATVMISAEGFIGAIPKTGEVVSKNKIAVNGYPGIEIKVREKDGFTVIARYYMVEGRLFCVMAMWMSGPNDSYVITTLESFKVLKTEATK